MLPQGVWVKTAFKKIFLSNKIYQPIKKIGGKRLIFFVFVIQFFVWVFFFILVTLDIFVNDLYLLTLKKYLGNTN